MTTGKKVRWLVGMNSRFIEPPHDPTYPFYSSTFRGSGSVALKNAYVPEPCDIVYQMRDTFKVVMLYTTTCALERDPAQAIPNPTCWIHVDKEAIKQNASQGTNYPVCSITRDGETMFCNELTIHGPCVLVYDADAQPSVVIHTSSKVEIKS